VPGPSEQIRVTSSRAAGGEMINLTHPAPKPNSPPRETSLHPLVPETGVSPGQAEMASLCYLVKSAGPYT
jgi:hypothetical protein